jgi:hypothetical protein
MKDVNLLGKGLVIRDKSRIQQADEKSKGDRTRGKVAGVERIPGRIISCPAECDQLVVR